MPSFEFISHEKFPEENYTKEAVVLCFDGRYRVTYVKKKMSNGGMFWDVITLGVKQYGEKKYLKSFSQDSNFLNDDIKNYLETRAWEKSKGIQNGKKYEENEEMPF